MAANRQFGDQERAMPSRWDLEEIRNAVRTLRASSPQSVLADLVEEKLRVLDESDPASRRAVSLPQGRRIFS